MSRPVMLTDVSSLQEDPSWEGSGNGSESGGSAGLRPQQASFDGLLARALGSIADEASGGASAEASGDDQG